MPAYLIATKMKTRDAAELARYQQAAVHANTGEEKIHVAYANRKSCPDQNTKALS